MSNISASPLFNDVPAEKVKVVKQYGNPQATEIRILTEMELVELRITGKTRPDVLYMVCEIDGDKERLTTLAIQKHYLQS